MILARRNIIVLLALIVLALGGVAAWLRWNSTRPVLAPIGPARVQPQIGCGRDAVIVLAPDGNLWGWGNNRPGLLGSRLPALVPRPRQISAETNWIAVTADISLAAAIKADGTLWTWGLEGTGLEGAFKQARVGRDWCAVGAGDLRLLAMKTNGTLWFWGLTNAHRSTSNPTYTYPSRPTQVGINSDWIAIPVGFFYHSLGIQRDGSLWLLGFAPTLPGPSRLGTDTNWVSVHGGSRFSLARKADGSWWARGPNVPLLLGYPVGCSSTQLVCLPQTEHWEVVAAGRHHVLGLTRNGAMRALGYNHLGQLGDGTTNSHPTPIEIASDNTWVAIGAQRTFSVALAADGSLWTWGERLGESSERSRFIRALGVSANRLGLRAAWAEPKPPRFDTKPRCILRFTTNAPARPK